MKYLHCMVPHAPATKLLANSPVSLFVVQKHVAVDFNKGNEHRIHSFGP